jgi:hypothetical protein
MNTQKILLAATLTALLGLVACGKKVESVPVPVVAASAPVVDEGPSVEQAVDAMLRSHPNSRKVCVDGERQHTYFLDYGPLLSPGADEDGRYHGWLFIERVDFYKTSNGTWFNVRMDENRYVQAYPDVTGLFCKGH